MTYSSTCTALVIYCPPTLPNISKPRRDKSQPTCDQSKSKYVEHKFHLSPTECITLKLPRGMTQRQADRLAAAIRTFPFNPEMVQPS
jgi:hypothetical protein